MTLALQGKFMGCYKTSPFVFASTKSAAIFLTMAPPLHLQEDPTACSNQSPGGRKRRARFSTKPNEIFPIPHIRDLAKDEVRAIWYERTDYEAMKHSFIPIVRKMMKGEPIEENNEQSTRGLEYRTRKGAIRRQHNKLEAISAVLDEQDRQYNEGMLSDELLKDVYRSCSMHCQEEAYMLGLKDEAMMKDLVNEPELTETDVSSEDELLDMYESSESDRSEENPSQEEKKIRRLNKLFKQVRIRRRALLEDLNAKPGGEVACTSATHAAA